MTSEKLNGNISNDDESSREQLDVSRLSDLDELFLFTRKRSDLTIEIVSAGDIIAAIGQFASSNL